MKGFIVESGYMGYVNGSYRLFASEGDYYEFMEMYEDTDPGSLAA